MAVGIVNHNTRDLLRACVRSALEAGADEVVLVDNASTDGAPAMVRAEFPAVRVAANAHNPGMGAACNQAVGLCAAPYVLLLNSDTVLRPGALAALAAYLDAHPRAGLAGPRLLNPDGSLQPSCFHDPTPAHVALELAGAEALIARLPLLRGRYLRTWAHDRARQAPWVLGAALAVRRAAFAQVGGFDESYFMYSEEVDLCRRLRLAGWEVHFTPATEVTHVGGASTGRVRLEMTRQLFRSRAAFYRRHCSPAARAGLRLVVGLGVGAKLGRDLARLLVARGGPRAALAGAVTTWAYVLKDLGQP
jgi:GT2 family glycosyltransferase